MANDELLHCPFCGGGAGVIGGRDYGFAVQCVSMDRECQAAMGRDYDRDAMPDNHYATEEEAIAAWNRRALPSAVDGWRPIESAPPLDGTQVILWRDGEAFSARWVNSSVMGPVWATADGYVIFKATHWMPLPAAPARSTDTLQAQEES